MLANTYIRSTAHKIHKCSRTFWGRNFEWNSNLESPWKNKNILGNGRKDHVVCTKVHKKWKKKRNCV